MEFASMSREITSKPVLWPEEIASIALLQQFPPEYHRLLEQGGTISDLCPLFGGDYAEAALRVLPAAIALKKFNTRPAEE